MVVIRGKCQELYKIVGWRPSEDEEVSITASDGYSWNGWINVYQYGRLIYSSFRTGIRWEVCRHILNCPVCMVEYEDEIEEINEALHEIKKEWAEVTGNKFRFLPIIFDW